MGTEHLSNAINDFNRARSRAVIRELMARVTGQNIQLLNFDEVRTKLQAQNTSSRGLQDIPLHAIVGSVGRYDDFTRDFLPRKTVEAERWARVELAFNRLTGLDPIDVYKIGEVYFVKDGNHRVSVARQLGATRIEAYVTEIQTRVPLTPEMSPDEIILQAEYAAFLERTRIDQTRPQGDLTVSVPGQYAVLEEHIAVHRYYLGLERQAEPDFEEAAASWYDNVYLPLAQIIWSRGILKDLPKRTEADLYLWLVEHRAALEEAYGREIRPESAADDLAAQFSPRPERVASRLTGKLLDMLIPDPLDTGPAPGYWRREKAAGAHERLFTDILVPISGIGESWSAVDEAILVAQRENGRLQGLHITSPDDTPEHAAGVEEEFYRRCREAGVAGQMLISEGDITRTILAQARWSDLLVVHLACPPSTQLLSAQNSGWRKLIQRCSRPILAVPGFTPLNKVLLAYDGGAKSEEALYVAAYLTGLWKIPLVVLTVFEDKSIAPETLLKAQYYLEQHGQEGTELVREKGDTVQAVLNTVETRGCDLILMGGYGHNPLLKTGLGSTVDKVLRMRERPLLICR